MNGISMDSRPPHPCFGLEPGEMPSFSLVDNNGSPTRAVAWGRTCGTKEDTLISLVYVDVCPACHLSPEEGLSINTFGDLSCLARHALSHRARSGWTAAGMGEHGTWTVGSADFLPIYECGIVLDILGRRTAVVLQCLSFAHFFFSVHNSPIRSNLPELVHAARRK